MIPGGLILSSRKSIILHVLLCARPYRVRGASKDRKLSSVWTSSRRRGRSTVFSRGATEIIGRTPAPDEIRSSPEPELYLFYRGRQCGDSASHVTALDVDSDGVEKSLSERAAQACREEKPHPKKAKGAAPKSSGFTHPAALKTAALRSNLEEKHCVRGGGRGEGTRKTSRAKSAGQASGRAGQGAQIRIIVRTANRGSLKCVPTRSACQCAKRGRRKCEWKSEGQYAS